MRTLEQIQFDFIRLLSTSSPSRQERQAAEIVADLFRNMGLTAEFDDAGTQIGGDCGNLWVRVPGNLPGVPPLLLNAHIDTVIPCDDVQPQLRDGIIYSNGDTVLGGDDKAGVMTIIEATRRLIDERLPHGDLEIIITVAEEIGLYGAFALDASKVRARHGFAFDGGRPIGKATVSAPSQENLKITVRGKAAHAGVHPEDGINAIVLASRAIAQLRLGRIDEETTANVGIIRGGDATNIIPELVEVDCEARSRNDTKLRNQVEHMQMTFESVAREGGGCAEVMVTPKYRGFTIPPEDLLCRAVSLAAGRLDISPLFEPGGGGSDANVFNEKGIRSIIVNCGQQNVHTRNECIAMNDLSLSIDFATELVLAFAQLAKEG